ncbi:GDSL-type esterase/lipase family protein [Streptomyces sp. NEAU-W12]|uniref:GDSL-type esterase/lipase family protein n=1 Tax=Streptomyces sp. NEAU-W12 TaxID=2994668 RepID=UPI00224ADF01|nr:fibronectin type III domain-containing protein [Streptomyces sp. NEAU-W12]MCX2928233.1 fibronectin type III domain-containing protein [Streptomyces sp. NEAU-W12]
MRRPGWLTALVLAVTLLTAGMAEPAEAAGEACATAGSNFASQTIAENTAALRMGCARDAGALRSLANSDTDMVAAIDFNTAQRPDEWQRQMRQMVDTVRADKDKGLTLSESFDLQAQKSNVDFYDRQSDVRFDGSIRVVGDSLVIVIPAGEVNASSNWWQKMIAIAVGYAVWAVALEVCELSFGPAAPFAVPICAAVSAGLAGLTGDLLNSYFDGRSMGDAEVWKEAIAVFVASAVVGLGSAARESLKAWAAEGMAWVVEAVGKTARNISTRLGSWSSTPLEYIRNLFTPDFAQSVRLAIERVLQGQRATAWPSTIRVMVVGDSISQGHEGDYTWRYRLWQWFQENNVSVDFVGPYHGTFTPDQPSPPKPPPFVGEKPADQGIRVDGGYAAGVAFDSDHYAHWGRQAAQIKDDIRRQVETYQPDLVLLAAGFNDMGWFVSDENGTLDSVETIIDQARAARPGVDFAVATVPHRSKIGGRDDLITKTDNFNRLLANAAPRWSKAISQVEVVDWQKGYSCAPAACPAAYDGLHPNAFGEYQLATAFEQTLHDRYDLGRGPIPFPPENLPVRPTPVPAGLKAESSPQGVTVTWDPVYGAFGYDVRSRIAGQTAWSEGRVNSNRTDTTWTVDGIRWEYQVRTVGGDNVKGPWSGTVSAVAHPKTAPPPRILASRPSGQDGIELEIAPPDYPTTIDRYEVILFDKDTPGAWLTGTGFRGNSVKVYGLKPGHRYLVAAATWNAAGGGLPALARPVMVGGGIPATPTGLRVTTVDPTTVELDWTGAKSAAGYRLWVSNVKDGGTTPPEADENIIEDTHHGVGFLFPGVWNFEFCVTAVNGSLESDKSNCVIPPHPDGSAPTNPGDSALNLSPSARTAASDAVDIGSLTTLRNPDGTGSPVAVGVGGNGGDR